MATKEVCGRSLWTVSNSDVSGRDDRKLIIEFIILRSLHLDSLLHHALTPIFPVFTVCTVFTVAFNRPSSIALPHDRCCRQHDEIMGDCDRKVPLHLGVYHSRQASCVEVRQSVAAVATDL